MRSRGFIAMFVAAIVLVTGSPAMAQTSDLLASAERAVLTMEVEQVEQDQAVIRRRRSNMLALAGGALVAVGAGLSMVSERDNWVQSEGGFSYDTYESRPYLGHGLAIAAAGGGLLWWGLRTVEVPVRFDVAPTRGFRVSRSLGW